MTDRLSDNLPVIDYLASPMGGVVRAGGSISAAFDRAFGGVGTGNSPRPTNPYAQVVAVYASVKAKAEALALMPLRISAADDQIIESGPLVDLTQRPNPATSGRAFWRATSAFLDLFGRVHWRLSVDAVGLPQAMRVICPLLMLPRIDYSTGELQGWDYSDPIAGTMVHLAAGEVHTILDPDYENPAKPFDGMSPRTAASAAIAQYYKADVANESSLDNGVEPGGAYTHPGQPTEAQVESMRRQLSERNAGVKNRSRPMVLWGGMSWETISRAFSEMEFAELKAMSRTDICVAFGVPPAVVGYYEDSNYAHADSSEKSFWFRTVLPRAAWLAEEFTEATKRLGNDRSLTARSARRCVVSARQRTLPSWRQPRDAARRAGLSLYAWFDASDVPAVQKARLDQAEAGKTWIDKGVPLNAVIDAFDLPFEKTAWGDTWYKPMGLMDVQADALTVPGGPASNDPPGNNPAPTPGEPTTVDAADPYAGEGVAALQREVRASNAELTAIWLSWRASWAGLERGFGAKVGRHFFELRSEVLRKLDASGLGWTAPAPAEDITVPGATPGAGTRALTIEQRATIFSVLFDITEANQKLLAKVGPLVKAAAELGGSQAMTEAADAEGKETPDPFNIADPQVEASIRVREIRISGSNATLRKEIAASLADGVSKHETTDELAARIRDKFNLAPARAATIARTEVGGAIEDARQIGRGQAGTPLKSWLWSRKETGRETHQQEEEITMAAPVDNAAEFVLPVTGARTLYPRGPGLGADDAVNCGCTTLARYPDDSIKSVVARYRARGFLTFEQLSARTSGAAPKPPASEKP